MDYKILKFYPKGWAGPTETASGLIRDLLNVADYA